MLIVVRIGARSIASRKGSVPAQPFASDAPGTSDPVLGAYVLFTLIIFALYVASDNAFGATGRHWYPYIFAGFLCAAWYAPCTLPRFRRTVPIVAALIAVYALVSSGYATAAVLTRYYGAPASLLSGSLSAHREIVREDAVGYLWPIQGMDFHPIFTRRVRSTFATGSRLWAAGAAIFPSWHRAADEVAVIIDGRVATRTLCRTVQLSNRRGDAEILRMDIADSSRPSRRAWAPRGCARRHRVREGHRVPSIRRNSSATVVLFDFRRYDVLTQTFLRSCASTGGRGQHLGASGPAAEDPADAEIRRPLRWDDVIVGKWWLAMAVYPRVADRSSGS